MEPRESPEMEILKDLLGLADFQKVLNLFAGSRVYFPKYLVRVRRDTEIRQDYHKYIRAGRKHTDAVKYLSRETGLSHRQIGRVVTGQMELFPDNSW